MVDAKLRAWWSYKQGLDGRFAGRTAAEVLEETGWARSVGGAAPYLALFARARIHRADVDEALAKSEIHELPTARGCTYVLPARDYAVGLRVGQDFSAAQEMKTARKLGVTDEEIAMLRKAIVRALGNGSLDPETLKSAVGPVSRSLGPEGTKKGIATTMPLVLGLMQSEGEIRRIPKDGRLDRQRYQYALWDPNPLSASKLTPEQTRVELARRYFGWVGAATMGEFQWFSGFGAKAAAAATDPLKLEAVETGDGEIRHLLPEDRESFERFEAPKSPHYELVASIDGIALLRRNLKSLLTAEDGDLVAAEAGVMDLPSHGIFDRGRLAGLWEYDTTTETIAWFALGKSDSAMAEAVRITEAYIREELGDARGFSLDSPKARAPRIAALREGKVL